MLAAMMTGLTACEGDDGCGKELSEEEKLDRDITRINDMIEACCMKSVVISYEQLKTALASFYYIQEKYSGKKIREIEGVVYRCPNFVLDWENKDIVDRENTMFIVTPLSKDANGIYRGISVTPYYRSETAEMIEEINKKLCEFLIVTTNKNKLDEMAKRFRQFQAEYSGKLLCVDPVKGQIRCPNYRLEIQPYNKNEYYYMYNLQHSFVVQWQSSLMDKNTDGFITGVEVINLPHSVSNDYQAQVGEIVTTYKKVIKNENAYNILGERLTPYEVWVPVTKDRSLVQEP